jgi:hypothetical protein
MLHAPAAAAILSFAIAQWIISACHAQRCKSPAPWFWPLAYMPHSSCEKPRSPISRSASCSSTVRNDSGFANLAAHRTKCPRLRHPATFFAPSRSWQCLPFRPHRGNAFFKRPAAFTGFASAFERSKILASDSLSAFLRRHSGFQVVYDICHLRYYCTPMSPDCQRFYGHMPKINFWSALCNSRPISSIYILCIQRAVEFLTEVAFNQGIFVL